MISKKTAVWFALFWPFFNEIFKNSINTSECNFNFKKHGPNCTNERCSLRWLNFRKKFTLAQISKHRCQITFLCSFPFLQSAQESDLPPIFWRFEQNWITSWPLWFFNCVFQHQILQGWTEYILNTYYHWIKKVTTQQYVDLTIKQLEQDIFLYPVFMWKYLPVHFMIPFHQAQSEICKFFIGTIHILRKNFVGEVGQRRPKSPEMPWFLS